MNIELKDDHEESISIRTFTGKGGGVEFENSDGDFLNIRAEDLPILELFIKHAIKELES